MTDNTERYMIDNAGTLIDKKTCQTYDYLEEILPQLNKQEERIKEQEEQIKLLISELTHINKQRFNLKRFLMKCGYGLDKVTEIMNTDGDVE